MKKNCVLPGSDYAENIISILQNRNWNCGCGFTNNKCKVIERTKI
jgi:hypothetical protein